MKIKSCLTGASIFGILAGIVRLAQYIFTIDDKGFYKPGLLSMGLNLGLIVLLALGTLWILICGFGGAKKEASFAPLFEKSGAGHTYFWLLGILTLAQGIFSFLFAADRAGKLLGILGLAAGILWILLERISMKGKSLGLLAALPVLHLCGVILSYFWQTYKYIHISEYILTTLALCALLLFLLALLKPAANGETTRQRLCATAGLAIIFSCAVLLPAFPFALLRGITFQSIFFFLSGLFYLLLAILVLRRLSTLPKEEPTEELHAPDLSALNEFLSNLPEVDEEE